MTRPSFYKRNKLIYGVGINDANYAVLPDTGENQTYCPFYVCWKSVLQRCYSNKFLKKYPSYTGCSVHKYWHSFMKFRSWMITRDWIGKELDKDLLVRGNKVYGPDTCLFVTKQVNNFIRVRKENLSGLPTGVTRNTRGEGFGASCVDPTGHLPSRIGSFLTTEEACLAYKARKLLCAELLSESQSDPVVAKALQEFYK